MRLACVYCAGIGELFDADNLAREADVLRVNLVGAVETASVVLPPMIAAGHGHLVGLSSIGDGVSATAPSYAASKAGLSSYLGGLALALRPRGVQVTNVRFGFVDTKLAKYPVRPFMVTAGARRRRRRALPPPPPGAGDLPSAHGGARLAPRPPHLAAPLAHARLKAIKRA